MTKRSTGLLLLAAAALNAGCSTGGGHPIADYKRSVSKKTLDVPPDLSTPQYTGMLEIPEADGGPRAAVLPEPDSVRIGRSGSIRWLIVEAPAGRVWPQIRDFFREQGLEMETEEPKSGIIETAWLENRADIPAGFIQGIISQALPGVYSAPTRDKFRVRLERGSEPDTTEIYLTHYGVEQVTVGEDGLRWQRRPTDTELVNEMLNRLLVHIGVPQERDTALAEQAKPESGVRAQIEGEILVIEDPFARAWRRVGVALDRVGLMVEDRDRSAGTYFVRYTEQLAAADGEGKGWFSGWFSEDGENAARQFRVVLDGGDVTRVRVEAVSGTISRERIKALLTRLRDELG